MDEIQEKRIKELIREALWEGITLAQDLKKAGNPYQVAEHLEACHPMLNQLTDRTFDDLSYYFHGGS